MTKPKASGSAIPSGRRVDVASIMSRKRIRQSTRRDFLKVTATALSLSPFVSFPDAILPGQSPFRIAKWTHFLPEFDAWFETMAGEWGRQHNVEVSVDEIPVEKIYALAKAETKTGQGHDLFIFPWPPAEFQEEAIDHGGIYQAVASRYGAIPQIAFKSTVNPKTKKHFAFADSWIPTPLLYLEDCWQQASMPYGPLAYGSLRSGGQRIRDQMGIPCGLALTSTLEGNITCHTILYSFGGTMTNVKGEARIDARTTAALNFAKSLYHDAGTPDELSWPAGENVHSMLARKVSCTMSSVGLLRLAEKHAPAVAKAIRIQPPLLGSYGVTAFPYATNCSVIWKFSKNRDLASQFLADLIDQSKVMYEKSQGCNFPTYPKALPDLIVRLENDVRGDPPAKYKELKDALHWTPNLGAPGIVSPAWMEAFNTSVIPRMFQSAVKGELSVLDAARAAESEMKQLVEKWRDV